MRENAVQALMRYERLKLVQDEFREFLPFLEDMMHELGFSVTEIQADIASFMSDPQFHDILIEAQRGEAKTTIAAIYAVWVLMHNPQERVLVVSAGETQATEISTLITRIILTVDILEPMRPDKNNGDRTSVEAFDIHYSLKGVDKSPSVSCVGVKATLQGKRAGLLLADDVESMKNSATATARADLENLTRDFASIVNEGRVVWLGTPQTRESIYNGLPARGVIVRVWPGRYPTQEQLQNYEYLAPLIRTRLLNDPSLGTGGGLLGDQGKPTDPQLRDETKLQRIELNQGPSFFQLQHMLSTALSDAQMFPLRPAYLTVIDDTVQFPHVIVRSFDKSGLREGAMNNWRYQLRNPIRVEPETAALANTLVYIDPAGGGQNGDETAAIAGGSLGDKIFATGCRGQRGGYQLDELEALAGWIVASPVKMQRVVIEKNMGFGAFTAVFTPVLRKAGFTGSIDDDMVTGMKERRIIKTLEPVMARGSLVVTEGFLRGDLEAAKAHGGARWHIFSILFQLGLMKEATGALIHDDRVDALEGFVRNLQPSLDNDNESDLERARAQALKNLISDPMGYKRYIAKPARFNILRHRR